MRRFGLLILAVALIGLNGFGTLRAQDDLDSLDKWVREMHPDPFVRCGESAWLRQLDGTREQWLEASPMERIRLVNLLLQTMQDSHSAVSAYDWIWDVERVYGTLPIRWAIEGRALWVLDSGLPGLPEEVRVMDLNGRTASDVVQDALDLSTMEGPSHGATARTAAHNITPWVLGSSDTGALTLTWLDPEGGLPITRTFQAQGWRHARSGWAEISTRRPVVSWSFTGPFPVGSETDVTFRATDRAGNEATCDVLVRVDIPENRRLHFEFLYVDGRYRPLQVGLASEMAPG